VAPVTVLRSGSASDVGRVRSVNEDFALESMTLFAVADGMGGHAGGEVAARTAIDALQREFVLHPSPDGLAGAVRKANVAVWERSNEDPDLRGMGTTLTAAALVATPGGDRLVMANVGDSRSYRMHDGSLIQLSHDHSVAEELVDRGELSEEEAAIHPHRHILTRALGVSSDVDVDVWEMTPESGDRYLLCSDGLTNELSEERIVEVLTSLPDPQEAAERLVRLANEHGGSDNVTVVVLDVVVGEEETHGSGAALAGAGASAAGAGVAGDGGASPDGATEVIATSGPPSAVAAARRASGAGSEAVRTVTGRDPAASSLLGRSEADAATGMRAMAARAEEVSDRLRTRRITFRVLLFLIVLAGIVAGAFYAVRWYVDSSYFVKIDKGQLLVYEGRVGGFLGMEPKVVFRTGVPASTIPPSYLSSVTGGQVVEEPSLAAAKRYVCGLVFTQQAENTSQPAPTPAFCRATTAKNPSTRSH
jgi:serine/threonine protein phosphatase PrpC